MTIAPGTRLGPYQVSVLLGAGGMGEVYRAHDPKLHRDVAIKVLPAHLASDSDRLARFEREARTLASLNHPNIGQIFGLEEFDGTRALVMELVEGLTLEEQLRARGASDPGHPPGLPLDEALSIAKQMAEALEVAHEQGVVHRDLKPANVKVRPDGTVKVLDFGLAKLVQDAAFGSDARGAVEPGSATVTSPAVPFDLRSGHPEGMTRAGAILGTAAYMAPEQARGRIVDKRADIWAFGVVLYELLTGRRPFQADTVPEALAAVMRDDADLGALPSTTPSHVRQLVERCLEKDPRRRLRDIGEARLVLERGVREEPAAASAGPAEPATRRHRPGLALAGGLAVAVATFAAGWLLRGAEAPLPAPVRTFDVEVDSQIGTSATDRPSQEAMAAISPDGQRLLYRSAGGFRVRDLRRIDAVELPGTDEAFYPFWSPDSQHVGYVKDGRLWRMPATGGAAIDLGEMPTDLAGTAGIAWTSAGRILVAGSDKAGLVEYGANGGSPQEVVTLAEGETDFHQVWALPGDRGVLFTVHNADGYDTIEAFSEGRRQVVFRLPGERLKSPVYSSSGHLLYERETRSPGIWAVRFSLDDLETEGDPFLIVPAGTNPSMAVDGSLAFGFAASSPDLVWVTRQGLVQQIGRLPHPSPSPFMALSRDGRFVILTLRALGELSDLWKYDLERGTLSRLTTGTYDPVWPVLAPLGDRVYFTSLATSRQWKVFAQDIDRASPPTLLDATEEPQAPVAISPDGRWLVLSRGFSGALWGRSLLDDAPPVQLVQESMGVSWRAMRSSAFSPDGRRLAYASANSGVSEVYVQAFPSGGERVQISAGGGQEPQWAPTGDEIFYIGPNALMAASVTMAGGSLRVSAPRPLFDLSFMTGLLAAFEVAPDGERFLMMRSFARPRISVMLNATQEIRRIEAEGRPGAR